MSRLPVQFFAIPILALSLFFVWDFSQRLVTNARIDQAEKSYQIKVAQAQIAQATLIAEKTRVASPEYAEEIARSKWHWVRDGEMLAVTQVTPVAPVSPPTQPSAPKPATSWWQDWVDFLFGP